MDEVPNWRAKYHLSDDVVIRISGPLDRLSDFGVDEVLVYEGFFESDFRDRVPSLVWVLYEYFQILDPILVSTLMGRDKRYGP